MATKKKKMTKAQRAKKKRQRIALFAVEAVVLVILVIALCFVSKYNKMDRVEIDEDELIINEELRPETIDEEKIETNTGLGDHMDGYRNIALFGVDSRKGSLGKGTLSDTIIVASINEETKDVRLVSVFRDTYLNIGNDTYTKANAAYAKGGPVQAINMLNMNFDLNITDYATVGWAGVADTIDALGGVEIDVDSAEINHLNNYQVETSKSLGKTYTKVTSTGMQTLNGIQAVSYCRIRYTEGDDFKRTERQREVIQAIIDKAKKANIATLNSAANQIFEEVSTSLSLTEVLSLISDVNSYTIVETSGAPFEEFRATGNVRSSGSCVIPVHLEDSVLKLHQFLFDGAEGYTPSSSVKEYSAKISSDTGK